MKTVLITGAAGFLGSHLAKRHLEAGDKVLGVDDFCSSTKNSTHLKDLRSYERFTLFDGDITRPTLVDISVNHFIRHNGKLDLIYNFACPASPPQYQAMPVHTMLTCVLGTELMLNLADREKAVLVHASTSEVYGDPEVSPQPETYHGRVNSYGPRSCYDEGKRAAEALCYDYLHTYDTDARVVRIFNTFGPNMDPNDGRVVSNFICQALRKEKLTVYGSGNQGRSFCYVDDLIDGIMAMGALAKNPGTPINLGNPHEFTVNALAHRVITSIFGLGQETNWRDAYHWIDHKPLPVDDPTQRCPDIALARQLLGWEPKVQLTEGLDKTIAYFKEVVR